jgi:hypothetical protein
MSYWEQANEGYRQLVDAIIRPPRAEYQDRHLGPREFKFGEKSFRRRDFILRNARGMKIVVSHWEPFDRDRQAEEVSRGRPNVLFSQHSHVYKYFHSFILLI